MSKSITLVLLSLYLMTPKAFAGEWGCWESGRVAASDRACVAHQVVETSGWDAGALLDELNGWATWLWAVVGG